MDLKAEKVSKAKKRSVWTENDVLVLLELWEERASDLRRAKRNSHIYKDISVQMDHKFSPEEVHVKIKNFSQKYREEKKKMGPSGGSPSKWKHFNAVHRIIGSNAANSAETFESFLYLNTPDASYKQSTESPLLTSPESQPMPSTVSPSLTSPESQPMPLPESAPIPSPLSSPVSLPLSSPVTTSSTAAASSGKKRNHLGEVLKIIKEQNVLLKRVVEDSQSLSNEIVSAIREQNDTNREFISLMKTLIEKI